VKIATVIPLYNGKGPKNQPTALDQSPCFHLKRRFLKWCYLTNFAPWLTRCSVLNGFRRHHSTHLVLSLFSQDVWNALDVRNGRVGAVFVDLKKAFNSVQKEILIRKLSQVQGSNTSDESRRQLSP